MPSARMLRQLLPLVLFALLSCASLAAPPDAVNEPAPPPVLLARDYADTAATIDPRDYWVSEKLDGVRALWDGKTLRFRSGRLIRAPAWFTTGFPAHPLDGELWMGRQRFEETSGAVRRQQPVDEEWRQISYQVFELPGAAGTFSERLAILRTSIPRAGVPWLALVEQLRVPDRATLQKRLAAVVRAGGEGLMLHRADAPWQAGRSASLLKLKPLQDAEARVIGYLPGKGKYEGMVGSLLVETSDGRRFAVGSGLSDALRRDPPPLETVITYRYRGLTAKGLPRFATYWRARGEE